MSGMDSMMIRLNTAKVKMGMTWNHQSIDLQWFFVTVTLSVKLSAMRRYLFKTLRVLVCYLIL